MAAGPHVVVFPLPIPGHLNPFTFLAHYLVSSGIVVTLVHSSRTSSLLSSRHRHPPNLRIHVVPDLLSTDQSQPVSRPLMWQSFPLMQDALDSLLHSLALQNDVPSCLLTDSFLPWTHDLAQKHGIPRIAVWLQSATVFSMGYCIPELVAKGYLPLVSDEQMVDFVPGLSPFRLGDLPIGFCSDDLNSPGFQYFVSIFSQLKEADRVLVHSFYDLEGAVIDALRTEHVRVDAIGPLITSGSGEKLLRDASLLPEDEACLEWLGAQEESSVLYVSFGSAFSPGDEGFQELALGLEASQERFLWVIRPDEEKSASMLPEGFQARTQGRSRIVSWAPQLAVLGHPAVGAFLTHCGWNSTIESLYMGVPMIGFPQGADQNTNLKCILDWKVGTALEGGVKCSREGVEAAVREMMGGEEGKEARRRTKQLRELARKAMEEGSSKATLDRLVEDLKEGRLKTPSALVAAADAN